MKKILYLVTKAEAGGAQKYVLDLVSHLDKNQFQAVVAAGGDTSEFLFQHLQEQQIPYFNLKYLKKEINPIYDFLGFWEIFYLTKKFRPDIIHLNSSKAEILGSLAAKLAGIKKIIFTAHGYVFNEPMSKFKRNFYIFLERFCSRYIHKIICVSSFDRQTALDHKIAPADKLIVINNAINLTDYKFLNCEQARQELGKILNLDLVNKKIIGTIANLYKTKGLEYFIEAAGLINSPDYVYLVIGEGDEREKLESRIKKLRLKNFILVGLMPQASRYLKAFDIFVLPSVKEGLPYTILEAQVAGLPIIATNVGGLPDIIKNNKNGLLIEPKNPQMLADKIKLLLTDQDLYQRIKNNTHIDQNNFSKFIEQTVSLY